jgi:pimeloyl-ACP methyl ester carboxylesterase
MSNATACLLVVTFSVSLAAARPVRADQQISDWRGTIVRLQEGDVVSNGVRIHYHTAGEGPLLVLVHGIGGFWFDWRHQIPSLAKQYKVVAMTQRGFDKSDQPIGAEHYTAAKIAGDIDALITHFGRDKATIMAYDSGGFHAWYFAMHYPERTERLVAIGSYHPATLVREYATNPAQQKAGEYSRNFQEQPDAAANMAKRMRDPDAPMRSGDTPEIQRMRVEAANRSSFDAMMNFYKANWPRAPYSLDMPAIGGRLSDYPKVKAPTLVVYGREDVPLVVNGLNDLWKWVDSELTLLVVPGAGHGPHAELPEFVTPRIMDWLAARAHPQLTYPPRPR